MSPLLLWPGAAVCTAVLVGCICRIDMLRAGRSRVGWIALYILWAPFAGGVLIDLLTQRPVDWWAALGLAGVLLHLSLTRGLWIHGAPAETERS